jgi:hypothetical protein
VKFRQLYVLRGGCGGFLGGRFTGDATTL